MIRLIVLIRCGLFFYSAIGVQELLGQSTDLFVIAASSEGVLLDGDQAQPGTVVTSLHNFIEIPRNGHAIIIAANGNEEIITKSQAVRSISNSIRPPLARLGSAIRERDYFELVTIEKHRRNFIIGDSIFFGIENFKTELLIEMNSVYGEVIRRDTLYSNWKLVDIKSFREIGEGISFTIREYSKPSFTQAVITRASKYDEGVVLDDLYSISPAVPGKKLLEMAVYGASGFKIDQVFLLYQLDKLNYKPENSILQTYFNKLKEKYRFELFDFRK